jgi:hypothetical protein
MTRQAAVGDDLRERVARALSIPEHHTTWDLLTDRQKDLYRMQADYACKEFAAIASVPPVPIDDDRLRWNCECSNPVFEGEEVLAQDGALRCRCGRPLSGDPEPIMTLREAVCSALYANLRIEPVPNTLYDWRIEPESVDEATDAILAALHPNQPGDR